MKKLILNIIYALIPLTFAVLLLAFPSRTASILFIMLSVFILYGSLKELYFILKADMLSDRLRLISVIKNAINIILSVVVLFLSFSKPDVLMDVVVYIIAIGVYHHRRCILLRLDEIQHCVLMIYNASH